ncbi:phenylalanyl-tRNA synthetase subunit beta [Anopheles sinensis]|uniref:Phenylalanyl-tRNA synthetase subunit beta n=1 Tax=Anopheles sinensis TaxID=74873 RepID=A0A084VKQ7_ANOSI|nr:phenylalanyl-tRNA synthetase subunit beta [Anopheles sinensis]
MVQDSLPTAKRLVNQANANECQLVSLVNPNSAARDGNTTDGPRIEGGERESMGHDQTKRNEMIYLAPARAPAPAAD